MPTRHGITRHVAGAVLELDEATAHAFVRAGRAEFVAPPVAEAQSTETDDSGAGAPRKGKAR